MTFEHIIHSIVFFFFKVECKDKQQTTAVQDSFKIGDCCVFLKSLKWIVTEPIKYLWESMVAMKNVLVNLTNTFNNGNTVRTSGS